MFPNFPDLEVVYIEVTSTIEREFTENWETCI